MTFLAFEQAVSEARIMRAQTRVIAARKDVRGELKQIATRLSNIRAYIEARHYTQHSSDAVRLLEIATEASNLLPTLMRQRER